jgi:DNA modification methylase
MHEMKLWPNKGYVLQGLAEDTGTWLQEMQCTPAVIIADPPYGNILKEEWDIANVDKWIGIIQSLEFSRAPIYWWGGIGKERDRPFLEFILRVEQETHYRMRDLITWRKRRGYGKPNDYLFVREECAYLTYHGNAANPFHIPLTDQKRGYAGYNVKYPAKSEFLRCTNVWEDDTNIWDDTEILRNKIHPAQKAPGVVRRPIEVHTEPGDLVLDLYSGSGETSVQALTLERQFIAVERKKETAIDIVERIDNIISKHSTE